MKALPRASSMETEMTDDRDIVTMRLYNLITYWMNVVRVNQEVRMKQGFKFC